MTNKEKLMNVEMTNTESQGCLDAISESISEVINDDFDSPRDSPFTLETDEYEVEFILNPNNEDGFDLININPYDYIKLLIENNIRWSIRNEYQIICLKNNSIKMVNSLTESKKDIYRYVMENLDLFEMRKGVQND